MTLQELFSKFSWSHGWNAFSYIVYKILSTALSFFLYYKLATEDFSAWANIQCTAFLLILWVDCGFRKSIPRYVPEFAHNARAMKQFTNGVILFQSIVLILSIPIFLFTTSTLLVTPDRTLILLGCAMYITEGVTAVLQLIFHAYFWNKQFNLLATSIMLIQMAINMIILMYIPESKSLLLGVLITKICASLIIIGTSIFMLKKLNKKEYDPTNDRFDTRILTRNFIKHSAFMWSSNVVKSLSERNFLVPFFTATLGPAPANLFKVANDGALFFFRIVHRTIGTTDTALLAHVEASPEKRPYMDLAFKKLIIRMAALCIPLVILVIALFVSFNFTQRGAHEVNGFMPFVITTMAVAYLVESLFLPYERMLEVKQQYWYLFYSYIPYLMIIIMLISGHIVAYLGLFESIVAIHLVRLVSLFAMVGFAKKLYATTFPFRFILIVLASSIAITVLLYPLINYVNNSLGIIATISPALC